MIQYAKKWISLALVMMMVSVMLPVPAHAAGSSIVITNLYTVSNDDGTAPADDSLVPRLTSSPTTVTATITNIEDSDITDIYYEVTNMNSGVVTAEKSDKATKTGTNEITFSSVELSEGLNKIVVKLGETSVISSNPAWAYFTPATTISDLAINEVSFVPDTIYPVEYDENQSSIIIQGNADNAEEVYAYNEGMDSFSKTSAPDNDGMFYFTADESVDDEYADSPQVIALRGGDNYITFTARNDSNSYTISKNIIYDNGKPFPYLTRLSETSDTTVDDNDLLVRSLDAFDTQDLTLSTKIKADLISNSTVTQHTYMEVLINDTSVIKFNMRTDTSASGGTLAGGGSYTISKNSSESTSRYNVYDLTFNITSIPELKSVEQSVTFAFTDDLNLYEDSYSLFNFDFVDGNAPYIESVKRSNGTVTMSEDVTNVFNVLPDTIVVTANSYTAGVLFMIDDKTELSPTSQSGNVYTYTVEGLSEGDHTFVIQPKYSDGTVYSAGGKKFEVLVSNSPFVVVKNIYTGLILDEESEITELTTVDGIQGEVDNFAFSTANYVKIYINDVSVDDKVTWSGTSFVIMPGSDTLEEGKNTIKFEIYVNSSLIRTQSYEIYMFTQKTPYFEDLIPVGAGSTFIEAQTSNQYSTEADEVTFSGSVYNADSVSLVAYYKDSSGDDVTKTLSVSLSGNSITAGPFDLPLDSEVRYQFTATNSYDLTATTSITISREPVPYTIISPELFTNEKGNSQANVNSNFVELIIEADEADSVLVGKETATLVDGTTNRYTYTVTGLKAGSNTVKFTVVRGTEKTQGSIIVYNTNTNEVGASQLLALSSKMKVFDGDLQLSFPKGTVLKRYEPNSDNESFLTASRKIMFGIADSDDGRVDLSESSKSIAESKLTNTSAVNRFSPASKLYWIDAGVIGDVPSDDDDLDAYRQDALTGRGLDPYYDSSASYSNDTFFFTRDPEDQVVPSNAGELTIKFDSSIRYDAWKYVTVFHFSIDEGVTGGTDIGWNNIGGIVDMKNNTITVPINKFGYYQVMYMDKSYDDVTTHEYARDAMDILYSKGVMNGKSDYTFSTTESITRGEFAELLVKIFDIPLNYSGDATFVDVPKTTSTTLYEYKYIETAARAGIVRGTSQNRFQPSNSITRQDAAIMIARAAELKVESDYDKAVTAVTQMFTDGSSIDYYAAPSVEAVVDAGFIEGIANVLVEGQTKETVRFEPDQDFSRADAAIVAQRVMVYQKKIPN